MIYSNLLEACTGDFCDDKYCDLKKESADINIHPADPRNNCEDIISYSTSGVFFYPKSY